jgi:hypothetical protein
MAVATPNPRILTDSFKLDWEAVRVAADMKTSKYARDRWAVLKTKLIGDAAKDTTNGGDEAVAAEKPKKAATPRKRKTAGMFQNSSPIHTHNSADIYAGDGEAEGTPATKKTKKAAPVKSKAKTTTEKTENAEEGNRDADTVNVRTEEPNEAGEIMDGMATA